MPPTLEVSCTNDNCALDMFEVHYTYEMVGETTVDELHCPYCGRAESLDKLTYTYDDSNDRHR